MKDMRFYVTFEVTAQLSGELEKNTEANRQEIGRRLRNWFFDPKGRRLDYGCHIHGENIMSINDEKGQAL